MASHFQDFASHLVQRHGAQNADAIKHVFKQLGNALPEDADAQLKSEPRLTFDDRLKGFRLKTEAELVAEAKA